MKSFLIILIAGIAFQAGAITPVPTMTPLPTLMVLNGTSRIENGKKYIELDWSGTSSPDIELIRDGQFFESLANDEIEELRVKKNEMHTYSLHDPYTGAISNEVTL